MIAVFSTRPRRLRQQVAEAYAFEKPLVEMGKSYGDTKKEFCPHEFHNLEKPKILEWNNYDIVSIGTTSMYLEAKIPPTLMDPVEVRTARRLRQVHRGATSSDHPRGITPGSISSENGIGTLTKKAGCAKNFF